MTLSFKNIDVQNAKTPKDHNEPLDGPLKEPLEIKIINVLREQPKSAYDVLAEQLQVSRTTVKRAIKSLVSSNHIERVGGKRFGHWEVHEE